MATLVSTGPQRKDVKPASTAVAVPAPKRGNRSQKREGLSRIQKEPQPRDDSEEEDGEEEEEELPIDESSVGERGDDLGSAEEGQSDEDGDGSDDGEGDEGQDDDEDDDDGEGQDEESEGEGDGSGGDDEEEEEEGDHEFEKERLKEEAKQYRDEIENRGVVYLSSLPPYMKPAKVRHLLEQYGPISRVYLVEEDATARKRRIKAGGKRKKMYTEGWIEFENKKEAKMVAKHINGTLVGGKKRNFYHDDMWNIKYLKGFKWRHLTEKLAYERRVREQKLRMEMMHAKKENALFAQLVDKKKQFEAMDSRKRKRQEGEGEGKSAEDKRIIRKFRQLAPMSEEGSGAKKVLNKGMLAKVFKSRTESKS